VNQKAVRTATATSATWWSAMGTDAKSILVFEMLQQSQGRAQGPARPRPSPSRLFYERGDAGSGRKEKGMRKMGGAHRGRMVISPIGLTPLARNMDGMAHR
jgi:hypothetical protein